MIHARDDYNRIQDPENKIGEDEPVFLLRAKDVLAPEVMTYWAELHRKIGGDPKMIEMVREHAQRAVSWQMKNGCKKADL